MTPVYLESACWIEHDFNLQHNDLLLSLSNLSSTKPFLSFFSKCLKHFPMALKPYKRA